MEHIMNGTIESLKSMCQITFAKCVAALGLVIANIAFGSIDGTVIVGIGMLIIIDFITALIRELKLGKPIESKKTIKTAIKMVVYGLLVSAGYITEATIGLNAIDLPIAEIISAFIAITELVSILENVGQMGYVVPQKLLNVLQDYTKKK